MFGFWRGSHSQQGKNSTKNLKKNISSAKWFALGVIIISRPLFYTIF